ncbi:MAG: UDP-N-acetylglucosamine diphosphorylase/glucosamine-1-phosphate N-acetyltransferase [Gammaproteobacteria bacterium HGW-Gammaproteobacteria-8]|nr:MAG: UDP-N-acetylglucosamine diphosphorylase/glucosamine-1-phosphate N-acetyltransferase [Gammaproteobacteria bacterium HGW-Gammaproteobacteria-8]
MAEDSLHIVVLAAGQGKRMNSSLPKVLQPVGGAPMLQHVLETALALKPEAVHVVVGHGADRVEALLSGRADPRLHAVEQTRQLGTGHAVMQALPAIPDPARVLVLYGDMPLVRPATLQGLISLDARLAVMSFIAADPTGYGRILRDAEQRVTGIREQRDATLDEQRIDEVNSGVMIAGAADLRAWLERVGNDNSQHEYYLTDCVALAVADGAPVQALICDDADEPAGANDMLQLAALEAALQRRRRGALMAAGVRMLHPDSVQLRAEVAAGREVEIDQGVVLEGEIELGDGVSIGTGCVLRNVRLAAGTRIEPHSVLDGVETTGPCTVGPFARLRPGTVLAAGVRIGNFVETKNARFGEGAKANHLSYAGDAEIGARANLGAGTITCNYDGANKHRSEIGADVFIGSNSALVAPVEIGEGATIGAGSVVTGKVPGQALTVARARARTIPGWRRPRKKTAP